MPTSNFAGVSFLDRSAADSLSAAASSMRPSNTAGGVTPLSRVRRDINLVQLHDELWRVTRSDGDVLGYVESFMDPRGRRFRAKRLITLQKRFIPIGEFWSFDDAIDCLRFG